MVRVKFGLLVKITAILFFLFIVLPAILRALKGDNASHSSADTFYDIPHNENRENIAVKNFNRDVPNIQIEPNLRDEKHHDLSHTVNNEANKISILIFIV